MKRPRVGHKGSKQGSLKNGFNDPLVHKPTIYMVPLVILYRPTQTWKEQKRNKRLGETRRERERERRSKKVNKIWCDGALSARYVFVSSRPAYSYIDRLPGQQRAT